MEIEVGEYIRTRLGHIRKIEGNEYNNPILKCEYFGDEIVKHSKNIIDLIEVGDYVNGCLIVQINKDPFVKNQINLWTNMTFSGKPLHTDYFIAKITANEIKSIVTKENFNSIKYEVE